MNRGVLRVLLGVAALVGALLLLGFALPQISVTQRSDEIAAPPATVYELLSDLRAARRWSPWRNPRTRYLFSGPLLGVGARMDWSGASRGSSVVVDAVPYVHVVQRIELDGRRRRGAFQLTRSAQGTHVSWRMETDAGANPFARWQAYLGQNALGATLERGLEKLGDVAETLPHADMEGAKVRLTQVPPRLFAYVEGETEREPEAIARSLASARVQVKAALKSAGAAPSSGPIWIALGSAGSERVAYRAGVTYDGVARSSTRGVVYGRLEGGPIVQAEHLGPPETLPQVEAAARLYLGVHQLPAAGPPVIEFSADPVSTPPDRLVATLRLPVRSAP